VSDLDHTGTDAAGSPRTTIVLLAIMAVALLAAAVAGGFYWGSNAGDPGSGPRPSAVDIGFARDMAAHHQQAVEMAAYARDNSTNPQVVHLAYDIETNQSLEVGEMTGWLDTWGLTRYSAHPMAWMGHAHDVVDGLMPGMATAAQINELMSSKGHALDVLFLQLMIHHHQGGGPMARYAAQHASLDYVRTLAGHMVANQTTETLQMERLLRSLGASPLPAPAGD